MPSDALPGDPVPVNAIGMKCPWPALRAARALRDAHAVMVEADDPIAGRELAALAQEHGWRFAVVGPQAFLLSRSA